MKQTLVIITLFSADKVRLDEDSVARILGGDYPVRVKSKVLATIRELSNSTEKECVVGFLPLVKESYISGIQHWEIATQDHYGEMALYLAPETTCDIVPDLISCKTDGGYSCREDVVRDSSVIVIGDTCEDWSPIVECIVKAGADSVRCINIFQQ